MKGEDFSRLNQFIGNANGAKTKFINQIKITRMTFFRWREANEVPAYISIILNQEEEKRDLKNKIKELKK